MAKEIEHKFLVDTKLWNKFGKPNAHNCVSIKQGYLSKKVKQSIRVRIVSPVSGYASGTKQGFLTIKGKMKGYTRDEFEYSIPLEDAKQMMKMAEEKLTKIRYYWFDQTHHWFVDEYTELNKGLVVAEIELKSENESFDIPEWCLKDITHDKRYSNSYLCHAKAPAELHQRFERLKRK